MHDSGSASLSKAWWALLITLFLLAGVIGHDPWKQDETYTFGIIYNFYTTHSWLIPVNAGEPFMEKPPLYYWTAVLLCKLLSPPLALHNAARLASPLYMLVTLIFTWKLSRVLFQDRPDRLALTVMTIALLLGSFGLARHSHDMFTDVALLAGASIMLYGMAVFLCLPQKSGPAGFWIGLGTGIAFLSKGLPVPAIMGLAGIALWVLHKDLRLRNTLETVCIALLTASPLLLIWPLALYHYSPELFNEWFWANNVGRFSGATVARLGAGSTHCYFLHVPFWFAFPIFPLACIAVYKQCERWRQPEYFLPIIVSGVGLAILLASASARSLYLLPLFPAFALLAAQGMTFIPEKCLYRWNMLARALFSMAIAGAWLLWASLRWPALMPWYAALFKDSLPLGFVPPYNQWPAGFCALTLTVLWTVSLRFNARLPLNTAKIWFAGIAALWGVTNTLLLPWIDETKSYRPVIEKLNVYMRESPYRAECIGNYRLGESIGPMLQYFGDAHAPAPIQNEGEGACPLILMDVAKSSPQDIDPHWQLVWRGERVLDTKNMELRLYAHK